MDFLLAITCSSQLAYAVPVRGMLLRTKLFGVTSTEASQKCEIWGFQTRQAMYLCNIAAHSHDHPWTANAISNKYSVCVLPHLSSTQRARTTLCCHLQSAWLYRNFPHCLCNVERIWITSLIFRSISNGTNCVMLSWGLVCCRGCEDTELCCCCCRRSLTADRTLLCT
jgi:hypothetical protein